MKSGNRGGNTACNAGMSGVVVSLHQNRHISGVNETVASLFFAATDSRR
jgi:hypothetical protein